MSEYRAKFLQPFQAIKFLSLANGNDSADCVRFADPAVADQAFTLNHLHGTRV